MDRPTRSRNRANVSASVFPTVAHTTAVAGITVGESGFKLDTLRFDDEGRTVCLTKTESWVRATADLNENPDVNDTT